MSSTVMDYEVIDEDLEIVPEKKSRKGKAPAIENPDVDALSSPDEMAQLMRDMANTAAQQAFELALKNSSEIIAKSTGDTMAKLKSEAEALREYMEKQSKLYAKPQNLCMHVKYKDAPVKKLKQRISPLMADVLMQLEIGRSGGKWPLIMGPTGSGKTVLARQVAETLEKDFRYVNCSEGMGETVFFGKETIKGFVPGPLWICATQGGVFLFDEWDAASDNVAVSVNTILTSPAGSMITNPFSGEVKPVHPDFMAIAATNTNGKGGDGAYTGRNRLDGASLNRFAIFELSYDTDLERELCSDTTLLERLWSIRVALTEKKSKDVISTRDIADAYAQSVRGYPVEKILNCLRLRMDRSNHELFTGKGK